MSVRRHGGLAGPTGGYVFSSSNGNFTTIAANDPVASWRNASGRMARITRLRGFMVLVTAFAAAQRVALGIRLASAWTADDAGGADVSNQNTGKTAGVAGPAGVSSRTGGAGALTAGTRTLAAGVYFRGEMWAGAVGNRLDLDFAPQRPEEYLYIPHQAGLVLQNTVLMGAGGVAAIGWHIEYDFGA